MVNAYWSRENAAWIAGLFEGEGSFTIRKNRVSPQATVCMTDWDIIDRLHKTVGFGKVYRRVNPPFKTSWAWQTTTVEHYQQFLCIVWHWLGQRRKARGSEILRLNCTVKHAKFRTACPRGHTYDVIHYDGHRGCRTCNVEHNRKSLEKKKAAKKQMKLTNLGLDRE